MVFEYKPGYRYLENMVIIYMENCGLQKIKYYILNNILFLKNYISFILFFEISMTKNSWNERSERNWGGMFFVQSRSMQYDNEI